MGFDRLYRLVNLPRVQTHTLTVQVTAGNLALRLHLRLSAHCDDRYERCTPTAERPTRASVLVVDDEPTIGEVWRATSSAPATRTRVAGDGPQALALSAQSAPDLVVLDIMLPGIDGLEVMRRLHERDGSPARVILLTARGREAERIVGLRRGADDYVVKPFSPSELVARVEAVLRRERAAPVAAGARTPEPAPALRFEGLLIEPATRRVLVGATRGHPDRARVRPARPSSRATPDRSSRATADGARVAAPRLQRQLDRHGPHPPAARQARARPRASRATSRPCGASATASGAMRRALPTLLARLAPGAGPRLRGDGGDRRRPRGAGHGRDPAAHRLGRARARRARRQRSPAPARRCASASSWASDSRSGSCWRPSQSGPPSCSSRPTTPG